MNAKTDIQVLIVLLLSGLLTLFSGCSDQFMKDKTNYNLISPDAVYGDFKGAQSRVDYLYRVIMSTTSDAYMSSFYSIGRSDIFSQSTEEYSGISTSNYWINQAGIDITKDADFFYFENKANNPWGRIRECNDVIENVIAADFTTAQKEELLGQAYFWRAWCYYQLVKLMGGVPIIDRVQEPIVGNNKEGMAVPRSTTRECVDFICRDLQTAADYLPVKWPNESIDFGRLTRGAALAVMGRVRLLYASPLFNRQDDRERWELAYEVNKAARDLLKYTDSKFPGVNASEWARMFAPAEITHPEAVLFTLYSIADNNNKLNGWENAIRPKNIYGGNGIDVTYNMIDLFPMADGKRPAGLPYTRLPQSDIQYNENLFFLNRDPRFYRTVAFPGERWAANADLNPVRDDSVGVYLYPYQAQNYELWSYAWFKDSESMQTEGKTSDSWIADGIGNTRRTVYLRKRSDDYDISNTNMYTFTESRKYAYSYAPYLELRYGEVLLNFAEAACGAGQGQEALEALRELRSRVGYSGDCGLPGSLAGDRAALFSAILYERQIELAYEGKRFDDMRRWMLWDGGATQNQIEGAPAHWMPSGWENNTCIYLGVPPLNGTSRAGIYIYYKGGPGEQDDNKMDPENPDSTILNDPLQILAAEGDQSAIRPRALDLMKDEVSYTGAMADLADYYNNHFGIKRLLNQDGFLDDDQTPNVIDWKPQNYFIGLRHNAQAVNPTLLQTIGWADRQGHGTWFDPLAE